MRFGQNEAVNCFFLLAFYRHLNFQLCNFRKQQFLLKVFSQILPEHGKAKNSGYCVSHVVINFSGTCYDHSGLVKACLMLEEECWFTAIRQKFFTAAAASHFCHILDSAARRKEVSL